MARSTLAALLSLALCSTGAQAAKLVVMGINLNGPAPAGQKIFTIGFDTQGASGFLAVGNLVFRGTGNASGNPKQANFAGVAGAANNRSTRQAVETGANSANNRQYD